MGIYPLVECGADRKHLGRRVHLFTTIVYGGGVVVVVVVRPTPVGLRWR